MGKRPPPPSFRRALKRVQEKAQAAAIGPGTLLGERYEVLQELGRGAFGVVFRALDRQSQEAVAVKVLHEHMSDDQMRLRMHREAHAMKQLVDTCAVGILDYDHTPAGQQYLVMEYLDGQNLEQLVESYEGRGRRMSLFEVGSVLHPIVETLRVAHERQIIHRDLKPENIFVLRNGATRLLDFGLVKALTLEQMTAAGMIAGSPSFIAPESWAGQPDQLDHRIDVYALGVIVFRLLAGKTPFDQHDDVLQLMMAVTTGERPSLRAFRPQLHASVDQWTQMALAIKPDERFQTVDQLWEGLRYVANQSPDNA